MSESFYSGTQPLASDTERQLLVKILITLGQLSGTNGLGGVFSINYAGPPIFTPLAAAAIAIDINRQQWQWYNGSWS